MAQKNLSHTETGKMNNIIIETNIEGKNNITFKRELKYNRLVGNRHASNIFRKNTVIIADKDVSNVIIESDSSGNNFVKSLDEYTTEEVDTNIFKDLLRKVRQQKTSENNLIYAYLAEKRESLQEKLRKALQFYRTSQFERANELYENVLEAIKYDNCPDEYMLDDIDMLAIKFALALSKIGINNYSALFTAQEILESLIDKNSNDFPCLYYYLAKIHYNFNNFEKAKIILKTGLKILEEAMFLTEINWPGTKDNMVQKSAKNIWKQNMESLLENCNVYRLSDAKCFFTGCQIEEGKIYFKGPVFSGYVSMKCTNKCNLTYHRNCWKKKIKIESIKNVNSLLKNVCVTDGCNGYVCLIQIYDEHCKLLSTITTNYKDDNKNKIEDKKLKIDHNEKKNIPSEKNIKKARCTVEKDFKDITVEKDKKDIVFKPQDVTSVISYNKTSIPCKNEGFSFNLNAKEYVPLHLNTKNPKNTENKNMSLNIKADEYIPKREITLFSEQASQCTEKMVDEVDYNELKCEINILKANLFATEENYNELLAEFEKYKKDNIKFKNDSYAQTEPTVCKGCQNFQRNLCERSLVASNLSKYNEELKAKIKLMQNELNELKIAQTLDRQIFIHHEQKFLESNKVLVNKLQELTAENDSLRNGLEEFKKAAKNEGNLHLKRLLLEQLTYAKNFYLTYYDMCENKCKIMIWELQDLKTLTKPETLPSLQEVEENLVLWCQSLQNLTKDHALTMIHFDKLISNFTTEPFEEICAAPLPTVMPEPPSLILRHFKALFLVNRRLEQDLSRHMVNYYKLISIPLPGAGNPSCLQSPPVPMLQIMDKNSSADLQSFPGNSGEGEFKKLNPPPGLSLNWWSQNEQKIDEARAVDVKDFKLEEIPQECKKALNENIPEIVKNKALKYEKSVENASCSAPLHVTSPETENKPIVVGPDNLVYRLQQRYPLISPKIVQEAVQILRDTRGGLSGVDSKTLMAEVRMIIGDLMKKEKHKPGYQKINIKPKKNPWGSVNNETTWQNSNPLGNCAICFEIMTQENSICLKCQHVFHTTCIKTWLQNDRICPICRNYITLDEEFPPLKSK